MRLGKRYLLILVMTEALAGAKALADGPDPTQVQIRNITYGGTGCPAGSVSQNISADAQAFTLLFDSFTAEAGPGVDASSGRRNCQIAVDLQYPAGWTYSVFSVDHRGFAQLDPGVIGEQSASYYFQGATQTGTLVTRLTGPTAQDYQVHTEVGVSSVVWSPCSERRALNINSAINVRATGSAAGLMTVDSIDGEIHHRYAIRWQRCPDAPPPPPPPPAQTRPVYRKVNVSVFNYLDHLFTLNPNEAAGGYRDEGVGFNVFTQSRPGLMPLYRCFSAAAWGHYLSLVATCENQGTNEGLLGYVAGVPEQGTAEIVRCHQLFPTGRIHFLTTRSRQECINANHPHIANQGYAPL
jgi:hypothetical protein